jgi:hypothetical protein
MSAVKTVMKLAQLNTTIEILQPKPNTIAANEMDSNADTCCAGSNFIVLALTRRTADVYRYDSSYKPLLNVPIASAATAYDDPHTGQTYILIINECLYYGTKLGHSLINPNQLRFGGTPVWDNAFDMNHDLSIECENDLIIPLQLDGTKTMFNTRAPTNIELDSCEHVHLTSKREWEPATVNLQIQSLRSNTTDKWQHKHFVCSVSMPPVVGDKFEYSNLDCNETILHSIEPSLITLSELHRERHKTTEENIPARNSYTKQDRHIQVNAQNIATMWGIGINRARATLQCTTQHGVRSALLPLSRRYRADRMYNLRRLNSKFATDTFYSNHKSLNQNTCAQIYSHKNGFSAVYPMTKANGDTIGQSLVNFSHDFGIPEHLTFDGAKAQVGKNTLFMKTMEGFLKLISGFCTRIFEIDKNHTTTMIPCLSWHSFCI